MVYERLVQVQLVTAAVRPRVGYHNAQPFEPHLPM
jgi:hypothetical protein